MFSLNFGGPGRYNVGYNRPYGPQPRHIGPPPQPVDPVIALISFAIIAVIILVFAIASALTRERYRGPDIDCQLEPERCNDGRVYYNDYSSLPDFYGN